MLIKRLEFSIDDYLEYAEKSQFWFFDRRLSHAADYMERSTPTTEPWQWARPNAQPKRTINLYLPLRIFRNHKIHTRTNDFDAIHAPHILCKYCRLVHCVRGNHIRRQPFEPKRACVPVCLQPKKIKQISGWKCWWINIFARTRTPNKDQIVKNMTIPSVNKS